jgi:hypothetical protein
MFVITHGIAVFLVILSVLATAAAAGALAGRIERKLIGSPAVKTAAISPETVREHDRAAFEPEPGACPSERPTVPTRADPASSRRRMSLVDSPRCATLPPAVDGIRVKPPYRMPDLNRLATQGSSLRKGFLWGVAKASIHVEGGYNEPGGPTNNWAASEGLAGSSPPFDVSVPGSGGVCGTAAGRPNVGGHRRDLRCVRPSTH